jgi:hypothetical protein
MLNFDIFSPFSIFSIYTESKIFKEIIKTLNFPHPFPAFLHTRWRDWIYADTSTLLPAIHSVFNGFQPFIHHFHQTFKFLKKSKSDHHSSNAINFFLFGLQSTLVRFGFLWFAHYFNENSEGWLIVVKHFTTRVIGQTSCIQFTHFHKQAFFFYLL